MFLVFRRTLFLSILCLAFTAFSRGTSYPVGVVSRLTLHDNARNRDIPLRVFFPKTLHFERFPIVLFSHGAGVSNDDYDYLGRYWAQHGYVCIFPTHPESAHSIVRHGWSLSDLRSLRAQLVANSSFVLRPKDLSFLIDSLPLLEEKIPALKDRLDPTRVGVGGLSLGAYTALAVAGATVYPPDEEKQLFGDTRPLAYLALSPQGIDIKNGPFHDDSWASITRPALLVTGTRDQGYQEPPSWRLEAFQGLRPGHKYLAVLNGVAHLDFIDTPLDGTPPRTRLHRWLQKATTLFWDAYLKRDIVDQAQLKAQGWPKVDGVKVRAVSK